MDSVKNININLFSVLYIIFTGILALILLNFILIKIILSSLKIFTYIYFLTAIIFPKLNSILLKFKRAYLLNKNILIKKIRRDVNLKNGSTEIIFAVPKKLKGIKESIFFNSITLFQIIVFFILILYPFYEFSKNSNNLIYPFLIIIISLASIFYKFIKTKEGTIILPLPNIPILSPLALRYLDYIKQPSKKEGLKKFIIIKSISLLFFLMAFFILYMLIEFFANNQNIFLLTIWLISFFISFINAYSLTRFNEY